MKIVSSIFFLTFVFLSSQGAKAQISPEEHAKHHPGAAGGSQMSPGKAQSGGAMGGMGEMMKEMMNEMGAPKKKEFYPSLMTLPKLTKEVKDDLEEKAHDRMQSGAAIMNKAFADLTRAVEANDYSQMKDASGNVREGLAQFESGIATHELIKSGKSPQEIGLSWFKENLGLENASPSQETERTFFGLGFFHFFIMALLTLFSIVMIGMYFFKMRRAAELLSRLEAGNFPASPLSNQTTLPSVRPWKGKLKVATIYQETPTVKTFKLVTPDGSDLPFIYLAGQFLTLSAVIDGKPIKRAYTISSHPCDRRALDITIKREENGLVSRFMHDVVHEGDLIELEAAHGQLTFSGVDGEGIVLIGGGVGITPLMSVLRCLIACGMKNKICLLYACKSLSEFVYREELRQLQERNPNLKLLVAVEKLDDSFPGAFEGRLTKEKILEAAPNITRSRVHLCGPPGMMQAMRAILADLKVPEEQIKTEAFGSTKAPTPNAAIQAAGAATSATLKQVTFKKAGKTLSIHEGETVLELAETSGVEIPFSCRVGTCGTCKVKLLSGQVTMDVQDSLTGEDKRSQLILACQAKAQSNLEIEEP